MSDPTRELEVTKEYTAEPWNLATLRELSEGPLYSKRALPTYVSSIGELDINQLRMGMQTLLLQKRDQPRMDVYSRPLSWFDPDVSSCLQKDGIVYGLFLVHRTEDALLCVELLQMTQSATNSDLTYLLRYALMAALDKYEEDTMVQLLTDSETARKLAERILPKKD